MAGEGFSVTAHATDLDNLAAALRREEDGKELRKELAKNMRTALIPAAADAKSAIMSMSSSGANTSRPALRSEIAKKIRPEVRLSGRSTGARVKARKLPTKDRGFINAPKRTQEASWRTQSYGNGTWREQSGKPNWFDDAMHAKKSEYKEAALLAMTEMAHRIVNRIH